MYLFIIRPFECPHRDCNRSIAVTSLDSHFFYEHSNISFITTTLDARNGVDLVLREIDETLCIVVVKVVDEKGNPVLDRG